MSIETLAGEKAVQYLQLFEDAVKQYTPEAVETALLVVRINAVSDLAMAAMWLLVLAVIGRNVWKYRERIFDDRSGHYEIAVIGGMCGGFIGALVACFSVATLLSVWTWVGIFSPKLYLAYKLFSKVL